MLYKGYIETKGKASIEPLKNRTTWKTYEQVKDCDGFGGVLASDTILIDVDDYQESEILLNMVDSLQLNCKVIRTTRGRHFLFKNHQVTKNRIKVPLAIGIHADIKVGSKLSYQVLKVNGEERFCEYDIEPGAEYQELPKWLVPVRSYAEFLDMSDGDGRNQALFNYILTLMSNDFTVDETRECIRLINQYVIREPLPDDELETILRDEAFQKPVFFSGTTFLFDKFANYLSKMENVIKINQQLYVYHEGTYVTGYQYIESLMIELIPRLRQSQRRETLKYLELIAEERPEAEANLIAFNNGLLDLTSLELLPFTSSLVITNKIPWDYRPDAYNELADKTLDKIACGNKAIRSLLEECIGYCFYRRNELGKAFIMTGDRSNGKSTFLDMVKAILGNDNISALDLKELGDRFSTAMLAGKLANIGDDIGDDFLQGSQVSIFKKIVTGNRIKAEQKGENPFEFEPYVKLLFSANEIPRMKDKTGAILRRLIIIPFNATFTKDDPDYDPYIKYKLKKQESIEYLIRLGVEGLKRVLLNNSFTESELVQDELEEYETENNPIKAFIEDTGIDMIENQLTDDVYKRYQLFCADYNMLAMSKIALNKQLNKRLNFRIAQRKVGKLNTKIFVRKDTI